MNGNVSPQSEEYISRINRVLDYIEMHLSKKFSLDELAKVACFSKYHFHRIFQALLKESLFAFIQRLRVEKAARFLSANPEISITEVAMSCGFSSSQAFARSFRERFQMTATEWRQARSKSTSQGFEALTYRPYAVPTSLEPCPLLVRDVEVRAFDPEELAYVRYVGPYAGDAALFQGLYAALYRWALPRRLISSTTKHLVIYHDSIDITDEDKLRISACISIPKETPVQGKIGKMTLEGGVYAVGRFKLDATEYYQAWSWMYASWMPLSGFQPDDRPSFEYFPPKHDASNDDTSRMTVEICIPIKPF